MYVVIYFKIEIKSNMLKVKLHVQQFDTVYM